MATTRHRSTRNRHTLAVALERENAAVLRSITKAHRTDAAVADEIRRITRTPPSHIHVA